MTKNNTYKLELTWIGKNDERQPLEPRILIENKEYSYGEPETGVLRNGKPWKGNMLIHGDNLLALKALEQDYAGQVKCIYIDPPYNTGNAFEHYDDNIEHSIWLNLMYKRICILHNLLSEDGSLWISIDNTEGHYLKVICDEIFNRNNFVVDITYEKSSVSGLGQGGAFFNTGEKILVYKKNNLILNEVLGSTILEQKTMKRYNKVLIDKGEKELIEEFLAPSNGLPVKIFRHNNYKVESISLANFDKREGEIRENYKNNFDSLFRTYVIQQENEFQNKLMSKMSKNSLYSVEYIPNRGKNKDIYTTLYYYNAELCAWLKDTAYIENGNIVKTTRLSNVWKNDDIPKSDLGNEGGVNFPRGKKPEKLIERILLLASNPGDIVLDSFLGSGTTAAVAQKMGRRYIGIELGNHAYTHCVPRLKKVTDGTDQGGISKAQNWSGGSGFKFYELAPSLLKEDKFGNPVINKEYNADMLAAAMAKQEGYTYQPDAEVYWKQGYGSETDYIYTTTQFLTVESLTAIHETMAEDESLLICCTSFQRECKQAFNNISIKKIPQMLLGRCEFGKDDYSLNIIEVPEVECEDKLEEE
ncbi:site-specific DNA-methyltransferase [Parabacteroides sp. AGMB00274]|uniref:site-specific DNA-methyltransferase (adenine-specific) n=1 Tax=Parabacteroides faecalis TaxID=2924040 RepID=A0ABT0BZ33_9BACT|nr:site-specific DNA-methyltransferase [Parabacteroides faecalis]MCJ2379986.1 site-specific DNA-methyltransferase [Parabacteroides faecalis]